MSKQRLIDVLSVPSFSGKEKKLSEYITDFCKKNGIDSYIDEYGNVYATKGTAEHFPCVVAHIDTVHHIEEFIVKEHEAVGILFAETLDGRSSGIGGDDKAGVYVCLEMLLHCDNIKGAFFVGEEVGCLGSYLSDPKFFENVGYAIQFDAPFDNWVSWYCDGEKLFDVDSEFFKRIEPIYEAHLPDYNRKDCLGSHPYTDVSALKRLYDFSCINFSVGYHGMHSREEIVVIKEVFNALEIAKMIVKSLGTEKYYLKSKQIISEGFKESKKRRLLYFQTQ
jgi:putative aminopeptidase FrvX